MKGDHNGISFSFTSMGGRSNRPIRYLALRRRVVNNMDNCQECGDMLDFCTCVAKRDTGSPHWHNALGEPTRVVNIMDKLGFGGQEIQLTFDKATPQGHAQDLYIFMITAMNEKIARDLDDRCGIPGYNPFAE